MSGPIAEAEPRAETQEVDFGKGRSKFHLVGAPGSRAQGSIGAGIDQVGPLVSDLRKDASLDFIEWLLQRAAEKLNLKVKIIFLNGEPGLGQAADSKAKPTMRGRSDMGD